MFELPVLSKQKGTKGLRDPDTILQVFQYTILIFRRSFKLKPQS